MSLGCADSFLCCASTPYCPVRLIGGARLVYAIRLGKGGTPGVYVIKDDQETSVIQLTLKYPGSRKLAVTIRPTLMDASVSELLILEGTEQLERWHVSAWFQNLLWLALQ